MTKHIYNDIFVPLTNSLTGIYTMIKTFSPKKAFVNHRSSHDIEQDYTTLVQSVNTIHYLRCIVSSTLLFATNIKSNAIPRNQTVDSKLTYRRLQTFNNQIL